MRERRLTIAYFALAASLAGALGYLAAVQPHLAAVSPAPHEQELVDRAVRHFASAEGVSPAEWRSGLYPTVVELGADHRCVDFRSRSRRARSAMLCFRGGRVEREIVRGASLP